MASSILDELLERHPEAATTLGDHRLDDRLTDLSAQAVQDEQRWASGRLAELEALPLDALPPADRVDAQILAGSCGPGSMALQDLAAARPEASERRHDAMLAHGSPAPRHLRACSPSDPHPFPPGSCTRGSAESAVEPRVHDRGGGGAGTTAA